MENSEPPTLLPIVRWAQRKETLSLAVELKECQRPNITLKPGSITFEATGVGARGARLYRFTLDFFKPIDSESCVHKITGSDVQIFLTKDGAGEWWPRLTSLKKSPHFLKLDFSRWKSESDEEEETEEKWDPSTMLEDLHQQRKRDRETMRRGVNTYLLLYNATQYVAFAYIFIGCLLGLVMEGTEFVRSCYDKCGAVVHFAVMFSMMEVVHPLVGFMKGSWVTPFLQVMGRNFALLCLWLSVDYIKHHWYVTMLFVVWSAIEVVRYPHYVSQMLNRPSKILEWLRYTIWIPLYPLGGIAEALVYVSAMGVLMENGLYQYTISFPFTMTVKLYWVIRFYLIGFPFGLYLLLRHMWKMRCRKLGRPKYKQP